MKLINKLRNRLNNYISKRIECYYYAIGYQSFKALNDRITYLENKNKLYDKVNKNFTYEYYFIDYTIAFKFSCDKEDMKHITLKDRIESYLGYLLKENYKVFDIPFAMGYIVEVYSDRKQILKNKIEFAGGYRIKDAEQLLNYIKYINKDKTQIDLENFKI